MKGAIVTRQRADGSKAYHAVYRDLGGRQKWRTFDKKKAAERFLATTVAKVHDRTYKEIAPTMFREFATKWLEGLGSLKPSTARSYRSILEHGLIPAFGDQRLEDIGVDDVNAYLSRQEARLKPKTLRNQLTLLHKLFDDARESNHLAVNRLAGSKAVRRPRAVREEDAVDVEVLDPSEVNRLLDVLDPWYAPLFLTAVHTGMRLGELLGLQWGDIDWVAQVIQVRRTLYKGAYYIPKSRTSKRAIDVGDQLLTTLHRVARERFGEAGAPALDAPVFTTPDGALLDPDNLRHRIWLRALAAAKLRHVKIHSLRHTFASMLIAQGENPKYIQTQLGHASITLTMDTYGHLFPREKRQSPARLERQLAAARGEGSSNSHLTEVAERLPSVHEQQESDGSLTAD